MRAKNYFMPQASVGVLQNQLLELERRVKRKQETLIINAEMYKLPQRMLNKNLAKHSRILKAIEHLRSVKYQDY